MSTYITNNKMDGLINKCINYIYFGNRLRNKFSKELRFLSEYIPSNAYIIEAGAHTGSDTVSMSHAFKKPNIFAFEPEQNAYKKLAKKTRGYKNIRIYNVALGNKDEKRELFVSKDLRDASSSLLPQSGSHKKLHPNIILDRSVEVSALTIDSWARKNNVDHIDFMWLDMQGGELSALKAAKTILPTVKAVYTEVLMSPTYDGAPLYSEFKQWMQENGFIVKSERDVTEEQANVLFIKKY